MAYRRNARLSMTSGCQNISRTAQDIVNNQLISTSAAAEIVTKRVGRALRVHQATDPMHALGETAVMFECCL